MIGGLGLGWVEICKRVFYWTLEFSSGAGLRQPFLDSGNFAASAALIGALLPLHVNLPYTADGRMRWPELFFSTWKNDDFASFFHRRFKVSYRVSGSQPPTGSRHVLSAL